MSDVDMWLTASGTRALERLYSYPVAATHHLRVPARPGRAYGERHTKIATTKMEIEDNNRIEVHVTSGAHVLLPADKKRTFREFEASNGEDLRAVAGSVVPTHQYLLLDDADVRLDLVQRGRRLYFPRGEIPLDKAMDKGFVGHQISDLDTLMAQMEQRLSTRFHSRLDKELAEQKTRLDKELAVVHSVATVPYVCNIAAQCLNKALGRTGQPESRAFVAAMGRPDGDPRLKAVVKSVFGKAAHTESGKKLDGVISRRNRQQHIEHDEKQFSKTVALALQYCNASSIVADECAVEMLVLGKYQDEPEVFQNL